MNNINLSSNTFIGLQELQRIWDFLNNKTLLLKNTASFGIIKSKDDPTLLNFKAESGTNVGTIKIANSSYALDKNGLIIFKNIEDNISIPDDNTWYWVKIKHQYSTLEEGIVSIDASGNLTGLNTKFTEVLRGQPNHPSRIKLTDASLNTQEYLVQEVISDTSAVLLGVFQSELNLHYAVVGTFTAGITPTNNEKYPFQYDSCIPFTVVGGGLVIETVLNTAPTKIDGEEFYIARVKRNGSSLSIEDKRTEFWQIKSEYENSYIDRADINALIGVEQIRYDNAYSTLNHNEIKIGWGMRTTNWVLNSELRRITIVSASESGKFKTVADFTDGDFNNWRIYAKNGTYKKITNSILSGGQINLILESLNPDDYTASDELVIVPDVDDIQIRFKQDTASAAIENIESVSNFPIRQGYALIKVLIPVNTGTYKYNVSYRYKRNSNYTDWLILPNDTINGYYDETSFNANGSLKDIIDRNRKTYTSHLTNGYIEFISNGSNYFNTVSGLTRGDTYGVERVNLSDPANHPVYNLSVGSSKQIQIFEGNDTLGVDWFIALADGLREENEFDLIFENVITLSGFHLRIVENYVNTSTYDELIDFASFDVSQATAKNLMVKCIWDGSNWQVFKIISASPSIDISGKADKVTGATGGNFAGLDASGNLTDSGKKASDFTTAASTTVAGIIEIATDEETQTGTDVGRAVTPAGLESKTATETRKGIAALASELDLLNGDAEKILTPAILLSLFDSGFGFSEEFNVFTESESNMSIGSSRLAWFKLGDLAIVNIYVRVTITGSVGNQILFQASSSAFNHLIARAFTITGGYLALGTSSGTNISGIFGIYDLSLVSGGNFSFNVKRSDNSNFPVITNSEWNFSIAYMTN